jgi:exodeoxyribonuclease V alpha subunit
MVDLALMSKLVDALTEETRLILLGDKDQLASVESGAVLSDCIGVLSGNVVELRVAHRFNTEISTLAGYINSGDGNAAVRLIEDEKVSSIVKAESGWLDACGDKYEQYLDQATHCTCPGELPALFQLLNSFRILCALKNGLLGVTGINERIERILAARGFECKKHEWYPGRPVMVTRNDYSLNLYNGDIGICLPESPGGRELFIWFEKGDGGFRRLPPVRLPAHETAWALTIHKSQGSEFKEVVVVLPETDNQILSRELLYTAITRARERVIIRDEASLCRQVVDRMIHRQSGLAEQLSLINFENRD